ncbi:uncharacterized protein LOC134543026 isoform X2 [Bacillus rossius redtenbacheri]
MSSEELKFINTLRENGYEGHLDAAVFKSVPKQLMKWLSENINSSVLLKPDELTRLEEYEHENLFMSRSSEVDISGISHSHRLSNGSSVSSETDDSDIIMNESCSEDAYEDDSDDDDEIRALKEEIRAEDETNVKLKQLKECLTKKLVAADSEVRAEGERRGQVAREMAERADQARASCGELGRAYQRLVEQARLASAVLGSGDREEKKFLHQFISGELEENFEKFLRSIKNFLEKQKLEVAVPIGEGEKFLLDSAPAELKTDSPEELRVKILTEELFNLLPRVADLHKRQLEAECASLGPSAAESVFRDIQTGKYNISLEKLNCRSEELRQEVPGLEAEVEALSRARAGAEMLPLLLGAARELVAHLSTGRLAQERLEACVESYLRALELLRSALASQHDAIGHAASFVRDACRLVASQHSQAAKRIDLMSERRQRHDTERDRAAGDGALPRAFQGLLLGGERPPCAPADATLDLMAASLDQLRAQNARAADDHYARAVDGNVAVLLGNKQAVESLSEHLLPQESVAGFPSVVQDFREQLAVAGSAVENFVRKKEQFKSNFETKKSKINQNTQLRKEQLEWVKFVTHGKHSHDETFVSAGSLNMSVYEEARK